MHTPGGPLKYSLEGHQFAIFAMKLTSDNRYIISCSNKFITFDVVTSDLARQVYPKVEGLMIGLELSPDNKFAAAFTNNNTTILLNTLISEFFVIGNPLGKGETVEGLVVLDTNLVIYGQRTWGVFDLKGILQSKKEFEEEGQQILSLKMVETLDNYSVTSWTGDKERPDMALQTYKAGIAANTLKGHSAITMNEKQTRTFLCQTKGSYTVTAHEYRDGFWKRERDFEACDVEILMLELSKNEK